VRLERQAGRRLLGGVRGVRAREERDEAQGDEGHSHPFSLSSFLIGLPLTLENKEQNKGSFSKKKERRASFSKKERRKRKKKKERKKEKEKGKKSHFQKKVVIFFPF
jgi:hypothetical protein